MVDDIKRIPDYTCLSNKQKSEIKKFYSPYISDVDYIEDAINDMDSEEFSNLVQNASIGLVVKIAERGIQLAKEGGFDSFFKRSCVAKRLGKEDIFDI